MLIMDYCTEISTAWYLHWFLLKFVFKELYRHLIIYLHHLWELDKPVSPTGIILVW